jgi:hypothetical protein
MIRKHACAVLLLFAFSGRAVIAQEAPPEPKKYLTPQQRLQQAKAVYLRNAGGTEVPFNIIQAGFESWPRYTMVNSPDKADLLVEVLAPQESTGTSVSSKISTDTNGKQKQSTTTERDFAEVQIVKLTVMDAKSKVLLFQASERPKNSWKERARTESQIECAQKLFDAFHNRVEPENAQGQTK